MNIDLQLLLSSLLSQYNALNGAITQISDPKTEQVVVTEVQEIAHRIDLVQGLRNKSIKDSGKLYNMVRQVETSSSELTSKLSNLEKLSDFLLATKNYLLVVDSTIDHVKIAALEGNTGTDSK